jgi:hypothetical protein
MKSSIYTESPWSNYAARRRRRRRREKPIPDSFTKEEKALGLPLYVYRRMLPKN